MSTLFTKLQELEKISSEMQGGYWLFALFMPKDRPFGWDIVVSSPWLENIGSTKLDVMAKLITDYLHEDELIDIAKVVVLEPTNEIVMNFMSKDIEHSLERVDYFDTKGQEAKVILITAQSEPLTVVSTSRKQKKKARMRKAS